MRREIWTHTLCLIGAALVTSTAVATSRAQAPAVGQTPLTGIDLVRSTYTKYEYSVPMRDGAHLFTAVYVPKDGSQRYPFLITRTPYSVSPYGVDQYPAQLGPSDHFQKDGFIFVYQDARGRYMSEGEFEASRSGANTARVSRSRNRSSRESLPTLRMSCRTYITRFASDTA